MSSDFSNLKIVFVIIASDDPINEIDLQMQRTTWIKDANRFARVLILRGGSSSNYNLQSDTLKVPCVEAYENILLKTVLGMRWIIENVDFDLLIRTNVSTYFDVDKVNTVLQKLNLNKLEFGGFIENSNFRIAKDRSTSHFVTGTGIYLTHSAVREICKIESHEFLGVPEDLAISEYLLGHGAVMRSFPRVNLHSTHLFFPGFQTRLKSSEISNLASRRFHLLYKFKSASGIFGKWVAYMRVQKLEINSAHYDSFHLKFYLMRNAYLFRLNMTRLFRFGAK